MSERTQLSKKKIFYINFLKKKISTLIIYLSINLIASYRSHNLCISDSQNSGDTHSDHSSSGRELGWESRQVSKGQSIANYRQDDPIWTFEPHAVGN